MSETGTALITGASEGIGYELSKLFARDGYNLVLVARNEAKLEKIGEELSRSNGISAMVLPKDLSNKNAPYEIYAALSNGGIKVDVLVNNAGYGVVGPFCETDISQECDMLQVLVWAPTVLTKLFLKDMLENNGGRILNVASHGAFAPIPMSSVYGSAKSYILNFTQAIAEELTGSSMTVTVLCPGATRTQFAKRAGAENMVGLRYATMSAEKVAEIGYQAVMDGKRCVVAGVNNKIIVFSRRLLPPTIGIKIVKLFMQELGRS